MLRPCAGYATIAVIAIVSLGRLRRLVSICLLFRRIRRMLPATKHAVRQCEAAEHSGTAADAVMSYCAARTAMTPCVQAVRAVADEFGLSWSVFEQMREQPESLSVCVEGLSEALGELESTAMSSLIQRAHVQSALAAQLVKVREALIGLLDELGSGAKLRLRHVPRAARTEIDELSASWHRVPPLVAGHMPELMDRLRAAGMAAHPTKRCAECRKLCGATLRACNKCGASLETTAAEPDPDAVIIGFILGVERRASGRPLTLSLRHERADLIVFDSVYPLAVCHLVAVPTYAHVLDFLSLLAQPEAGLVLLDALEAALMHTARNHYWHHAPFRAMWWPAVDSFEHLMARHCSLAVNLSASQSQLHLHMAISPWYPRPLQCATAARAANERRSFSLAFVRRALRSAQECPDIARAAAHEHRSASSDFGHSLLLASLERSAAADTIAASCAEHVRRIVASNDELLRPAGESSRLGQLLSDSESAVQQRRWVEPAAAPSDYYRFSRSLDDFLQAAW